MMYRSTVVLTKEGKWYVARSVELGVTSQGKTIDEAKANLKEAIELYVEDQPHAKQSLVQREPAPLVTSLDL